MIKSKKAPRAKCHTCKEWFERKANRIEMFCSKPCEIEYNSEKKVTERLKEAKEALKDHAFYIKTAQVIFNTYIRERDKNKPCISCDRPLIGKYDAGHFYSVGANPELRFYEENVHGQCVQCNQHFHGNLANYAQRLPARIGEEGMKYLNFNKGKEMKYSIPELKELIQHYKKGIKELKNANRT